LPKREVGLNLIVDARKLKDEVETLTEFLNLKFNVKVNSGGKLIVEDKKLKSRDVKAQVKHFLHKKGYSNQYRVLIEEEKQAKIIKIEKKEKKIRKKRKKKGTPPSVVYTMPYFYPNHPRF